MSTHSDAHADKELQRRLGRIEAPRGEPITDDDVRALIGGTERRTASALAIYRAMRNAGNLNHYRVNSYRCSEGRGCLLLDVFNTPVGLAAYVPPVKLSPEENAATTDGNARVDRTSDGQRRWVEHADVLLPDYLEYWVSCDHVLKSVITGFEARANAAAGSSVIYLH